MYEMASLNPQPLSVGAVENVDRTPEECPSYDTKLHLIVRL